MSGFRACEFSRFLGADGRARRDDRHTRFTCETFAYAASEKDSEIHDFKLELLVSNGGDALIRLHRLFLFPQVPCQLRCIITSCYSRTSYVVISLCEAGTRK